MVINALSVQYNGGFLPDIILYHSLDPMRPITLGNSCNTMKSFCPYSQCSHLNVLTFPLRVNAQEVYMCSVFFNITREGKLIISSMIILLSS